MLKGLENHSVNRYYIISPIICVFMQSEIIEYWGYPSEKYELLTSDGYYLEIDRIPYGIHSPGKTGIFFLI